MPARSIRRTLIVLIVLVVLAALDLRRAPADQILTQAAVSAIHVYQATLSPMFTRMGVQCRFTPTCSHYGEACIKQFGIMRGGWMAAKRVVRCGPWTPAGTIDPPPSL